MFKLSLLYTFSNFCSSYMLFKISENQKKKKKKKDEKKIKATLRGVFRTVFKGLKKNEDFIQNKNLNSKKYVKASTFI